MGKRKRSSDGDRFDLSTGGDRDMWSPTTEFELSSDDPFAGDGLEADGDEWLELDDSAFLDELDELDDIDDLDRETRRRRRPFDDDN